MVDAWEKIQGKLALEILANQQVTHSFASSFFMGQPQKETSSEEAKTGFDWTKESSPPTLSLKGSFLIYTWFCDMDMPLYR